MITIYVLNLEFHYEIVSPSWFHYTASFLARQLLLLNGICFLEVS